MKITHMGDRLISGRVRIIAPISVGWFVNTEIYVLAVKRICPVGKTAVSFETNGALIKSFRISIIQKLFYIVLSLRPWTSPTGGNGTNTQTDTHGHDNLPNKSA